MKLWQNKYKIGNWIKKNLQFYLRTGDSAWANAPEILFFCWISLSWGKNFRVRRREIDKRKREEMGFLCMSAFSL